MIELTQEQRQALQGTEPLRLVDPQTRQSYVVLRADVYDRLVEYDDGPWTEEEMDLLAAEAGEMLDSLNAAITPDTSPPSPRPRSRRDPGLRERA